MAVAARNELIGRNDQLQTNSDYLLEGYVAKKCQLLGEIHNVPAHIDMGNRSKALDLIDNARRQGLLPWQPGEHETLTLNLSAYNVKLVQSGEVVAARFPIHEIASVSYVADDQQHLVIIKGGPLRRQKCTCYIFHCFNSSDAREICQIISKAFEMVYTEATMAQLEDAIENDGRATSVQSQAQQPTFTDETSGERRHARSHSTDVAEFIGVDTVALSAKGKTNHPASGESDSDDDEEEDDEDLSSVGQQMVQEYMEKVHKLLQQHELKIFAQILTDFRLNRDITSFLDRLVALYGEQRKFLLPGMRAFISAEHRSHFEGFLASHMGSSAGGGGGGSGEKQRRGKRTSAGPPRLGREESNDDAAALSPLTAASPPPPPPPPAPAPAPPKEPATVDDVLSSIQNEMEELELSLT